MSDHKITTYTSAKRDKMKIILLELKILLHFPEPYYAVGQWLNIVRGKPAPTPPSGSSSKLMKHFLLQIIF